MAKTKAKKSEKVEIDSTGEHIDPRKFDSSYVIDFEYDTEFTTSNGALFTRVSSNHFQLFPDMLYFDSGTSPFVSESYSIIPDSTFSKASLYVLFDNSGIWILVDFEKLERKIVKERILKLVSVESTFNFVNNLKLELSLKEIEQFIDYNKE